MRTGYTHIWFLTVSPGVSLSSSDIICDIQVRWHLIIYGYWPVYSLFLLFPLNWDLSHPVGENGENLRRWWNHGISFALYVCWLTEAGRHCRIAMWIIVIIAATRGSTTSNSPLVVICGSLLVVLHFDTRDALWVHGDDLPTTTTHQDHALQPFR